MTHIGVFGTKLQGFLIGFGGLDLLSQAGQGMTLDPVGRCVADTGGAGRLGELNGLAEIPATHAQHDRRVAYRHTAWAQGDAVEQDLKGAIGVAGVFQRARPGPAGNSGRSGRA